MSALPTASEEAFGLLEDQFLDLFDWDLAWILSSVAYNGVIVEGASTWLRPPRSVGTAALYRRIKRQFSHVDVASRLTLVDGALFSFWAENHRRAMQPVIAAMAGGAPAPAPVTVPIRRSALLRSQLRAERNLRRLRRYLWRTRTGFQHETVFLYMLELTVRELVRAEAALDELHPSIVVVPTNHGPGARALAWAARARGIPSLYVPHTALLSNPRLQDLPFDYATLRGMKERAAYSWLSAESLRRISVSGNPSLELANRASSDELASTVVLALSPDPAKVVEAVIRIVADARPERVIVAPHPRQDLGVIRAAAPRGWQLNKGRTFDLLRHGPLAVIQHSSGVGLEAMLLGLPCIEASPLGRAVTYPFLAEGDVPTVTDGEQLRAVLDGIRHAGTGQSVRDGWRAQVQGWCAATGEEAASNSAAAIRAAARQGVAGWIWDAWSEVRLASQRR